MSDPIVVICFSILFVIEIVRLLKWAEDGDAKSVAARECKVLWSGVELLHDRVGRQDKRFDSYTKCLTKQGNDIVAITTSVDGLRARLCGIRDELNNLSDE